MLSRHAAGESPVSGLVPRFFARELDGSVPTEVPEPRLSAVGTIAAQALTNRELLEPLAESGCRVQSRRSYGQVDELLADPDWDLAMVLSPHKMAIIGSCDALAPRANATGVADTLVRLEGRVMGFNTNAAAAGACARLLCGHQDPTRVLLVGTGATARSIASILSEVFPEAQIGITGRSNERAQALLRIASGGIVVTDAESFAPELIVHATTVGEQDDRTLLGVSLTSALHPGVRLFDLTHRVSELQRVALRAGCVTLGGATMLALTNRLRIALLKPPSTLSRDIARRGLSPP